MRQNVDAVCSSSMGASTSEIKQSQALQQEAVHQSIDAAQREIAELRTSSTSLQHLVNSKADREYLQQVSSILHLSKASKWIHISCLLCLTVVHIALPTADFFQHDHSACVMHVWKCWSCICRTTRLRTHCDCPRLHDVNVVQVMEHLRNTKASIVELQAVKEVLGAKAGIKDVNAALSQASTQLTANRLFVTAS